ncbi:nucleotidyltransferase domain-containing protein [Roseiflexus castenholzii]|jgi:predicted nucleotidyltransferase|uniref:DNA polymerase beta domain protein region n=1 Tax=Roseiflexus castenholzii (strain DSM 13941 / HLO8) TaxID=383372 RepID=A7NI25_ROSCS|nr:nucleotidyltransferase domain-containing protein [Roseiflexus castenholzii]ABU57125.1 DNA polymerase beta domain protein region [Roseiflexus castenholzii DSM 13941]
MKPVDHIPEIVRRIVQVSNPVKIVLFGSHARNAAGPDSDLDLLVVLAHSDHPRQDSWRIRRALRRLLVSVDIVVATTEQVQRLAQTPGLIYRTALQEGTVLYERTG